MNTTICINEISVETHIGVTDAERKDAQVLLVSVKLAIDAIKAIQTDTIADTVDYKTIYEAIIAFGKKSNVHLLETFAKGVLALCISTPGVLRVWVSVTKQHRLQKAKGVTVDIEKENEK